MPADESQPVVYVRVMVNVDGLRVGEEGEVELSPRIEKMIKSGYLQIIGHVLPPAAPVEWLAPAYDGIPSPEAAPVLAAEPVANQARTRALPKVEADGPESAHSA